MLQNSDVFAAMQTGKPYRVYKKAILGKVYVVVLDPYKKPEEKMLEGKIGTETAIVKVWNQEEDNFFRRKNDWHFKTGAIIEWKDYEEKPEEPGVEQTSDEDLIKIINGRFMQLHHLMNKSSSPTFMRRLLTLAIQEEKSEKILTAIKARIAELDLAAE